MARQGARVHSPMTIPRVVGAIALACVSLAGLPGCEPKVAINVGFGGAPLKEHTVWEGSGSAKVALLDVRGLLADVNPPGLLAPAPNPVDRYAAELDFAEKDPRVKGVIVRINSPGGTVSASDTMYLETLRFRETCSKPVVISMGEVAASGGYYLALAGDRVLAQPTSITASIGVIMPTLNFSEGLSMIGVRSRSIKSGRNKDLANPFEPVREEQYAVLQDMIDEFYARFKALVRERRPGVPDDVLDAVADGRVVTGAKALEIGLVDELGGLREAFVRVQELAGVRDARLVKYAEDGKPVQSAYAAAPADVNLLKISLPALDPLAAGPHGGTSGVYYLWIPPN